MDQLQIDYWGAAMNQWAVVLSDSVLIAVALAGGILTLLRVQRVGGAAVAFAGAACAVLVLAAIFDMVWWLAVYPNALESDDIGTASTLNNIGVLGSWLLITIGVGLLIGAANAGRGAARPAAAPQPGFAVPPAQPQTYGQPVIPQQYQPQAQPQPQGQAQPQAQGQAQPAAGWPQPQQQSGQPDWNIHSGVWSIPRGTFDGPPPDQQQR